MSCAWTLRDSGAVLQGLSSEFASRQSQEKCRVDTQHREAATVGVRAETHSSPKVPTAKCRGFVWAPAVPASASALNSALLVGRSASPWVPWGLCAQARLLPAGVNSAGHRFHNLHTSLSEIRSMWVSRMPVGRAVCRGGLDHSLPVGKGMHVLG